MCTHLVLCDASGQSCGGVGGGVGGVEWWIDRGIDDVSGEEERRREEKKRSDKEGKEGQSGPYLKNRV